MELYRYIEILWARKWIILLVIALTMIVVVTGTRLQTPVYQTSATLRIAASAAGNLEWYEYKYTTELMNTYAEIATSGSTLEELSNRLGGKLPLNIAAEFLPDTELILISVEDPDPQFAATAANSLAEILASQANKLYLGSLKSPIDFFSEYLAQAQAELERARQEYAQLLVATPEAPDQLFLANEVLQEKELVYQNLLEQYEKARFREDVNANLVSLINPAGIPKSPSKPEPLINYGLGAIVGLVGGVVLALVIENMDPKYYRTEDIQTALAANTLGKLPKSRRSKVNIFKASDTWLAEAFRLLVTSISQHDHPKTKKVYLVAGAEPKQGSSTIISNLAFSFAERGEKVIVIDCNFKAPKQHGLFELSNEKGLKEIVEDNLDPNECIQKGPVDGLSVLTSGSPSENPYKLLVSPQMKKLLANLCKQFDRILLDTTAILSAADAFALTPNVDGVILVARRGRARQKVIQESKDLMQQIPEKFIGLIVNEA